MESEIATARSRELIQKRGLLHFLGKAAGNLRYIVKDVLSTVAAGFAAFVAML